MGRKILFITTDQQRYDALGFNGGTVAKTPALDALANSGVIYRRAYNQNVVCQPARATMLTGLYPRTHGVTTNGRRYPTDDPTFAHVLNDAGYRTALLGKAHFDPVLTTEFFENTMAARGVNGPNRGFEYMECMFHSGRAGLNVLHYPKWLEDNYPDEIACYLPLFNYGSRTISTYRGGETRAVQVKHNPIPRAHYHTDWVADRTIAFMDTLSEDEDWFVWMSFPDPHHPWDPPMSEIGRVNWRDHDLPPGCPGSPEKAVEILSGKPRHWLEWYEGRDQFAYEVPRTFIPREMTNDQVREINGMTHIENELIDEAVDRVMGYIDGRGWGADTDVIFTTDHGELQGDYGLLFKGPYHTDALMRVPMFWRPAPSVGGTPAVLNDPVGHVDLAATFCAIAGIEVPEWYQGPPLPTAAGSGRERILNEWDDDFNDHRIKIDTMYRDGYIVSDYAATDYYDGSEGELYAVEEDPRQWQNLWDDPGYASIKSDLLADLRDNLPRERPDPLERIAPV